MEANGLFEFFVGYWKFRICFLDCLKKKNKKNADTQNCKGQVAYMLYGKIRNKQELNKLKSKTLKPKIVGEMEA